MTVPELDEESIRAIEQLIDLDFYRDQMTSALQRLSQSQRRAVELHVLEGLEYTAVASELGCTEGTARVRVHRGLTRLAELLEVNG